MSEILTSVASVFSPVSDIFGSIADFKEPTQTQEQPRFPPPFRGPITTPAFSFGGGILSRTDTSASKELSALRERFLQLEGGFGELTAGNLGSIEEQIAAAESRLGGLGALAEAAQRAIGEREAIAVGTAREALARRGVLGSSFASDAISRIQAGFAQERVRATGEATQIELAERARLVGLRFGLTEQQAGVFGLQLAAVQQRVNLLSLQIQRELSELGLATSFLSQVDQLVNGGVTGAVLAQATTSTSTAGFESETERSLFSPEPLFTPISSSTTVAFTPSDRDEPSFGGSFSEPTAQQLSGPF